MSKTAVETLQAFYDSLPIDHDHETGAVRGLLCHQCNLVVGNAQDSPEILRNLADYLEGSR